MREDEDESRQQDDNREEDIGGNRQGVYLGGLADGE